MVVSIWVEACPKGPAAIPNQDEAATASSWFMASLTGATAFALLPLSVTVLYVCWAAYVCCSCGQQQQLTSSIAASPLTS